MLLACAAGVASMLVVPPPVVARPLLRPAAAAARHHRAPRLLIAETNSRVVALADVHGDYRALCAALTAAGLLDAGTGGWCGGDTTLVQLGDILDRGDSEAECWELLQRLKAEAPASGGGVVCLVGDRPCHTTPRRGRTECAHPPLRTARTYTGTTLRPRQAQGSPLSQARGAHGAPSRSRRAAPAACPGADRQPRAHERRGPRGPLPPPDGPRLLR